MKTNTLYAMLPVAAMLLGLSGSALAETETFVVTSDPGFVPDLHKFKMKDNANAPLGLKIQKIVSGPSANNVYAPPMTNVYFDPGDVGMLAVALYTNGLPTDCQDYLAGRTWMGDDDDNTGCSDANTPGFVSGSIGSSDTTRHGWLRAFSSTRITNSAYYGDTAPSGALDSGGDYNYKWTSDPMITNVNPAYKIPFVTIPWTNTTGHITGRVMCGTGNNTLPNGILRIATRLLPGGTWQQDATPNANGDFSFVPSAGEGNYDVRAIVADGSSPRNGFPFSQTYTVPGVIPEPTMLGIAAAVCAAAMRRRAGRQHNPTKVIA